jgi:hypothetical protein
MTLKRSGTFMDLLRIPSHCIRILAVSIFPFFDRVQDCLKRQFLAVEPAQVNYWEIIAGNLSKAGWSCVSAVDSGGRTIFVVRSDEKLTAFVELESAIRARRDCA